LQSKMGKFLPVILFFTTVAFSQVKTIVKNSGRGFESEISIPQVNYREARKGKFTVRDYYEFTNPSVAGSYKLPSFIYFFAIPPDSHPTLTVISEKVNKLINRIPAINPVARAINDSTIFYQKAKLINPEGGANKIAEIKSLFQFRDFYLAAVKVNPYRFEPTADEIKVIKKIRLVFNFVKKVIIKNKSPLKIRSRFDVLLKSMLQNADIAEQFRSDKIKIFSADSIFDWINFGATYVKIGIGEDGIYRINGKLLKNSGVQTNLINPKTLQLFEEGKEIPIFVEGEEDGRFDDTDFVEFFGHRNYSKKSDRLINKEDEDYSVYLNRYTDTTFYFLTWNHIKGQRVAIQKSKINTKLTLDYYESFAHFEKNNWFQFNDDDETRNQLSNWHKNKGWFWRWLGNWNSPAKFFFNAFNVIKGKTAKLFFKLVSSGSNYSKNSHQLALFLNESRIDSQNVDRYHQVLLSGQFESDKLKNGENKITVYNYDNGSNPNYLAVDWYEVEYPRKLLMENDSLILRIPPEVQNEISKVNIGNAKNIDYVIYKVEPRLKKIEYYSIDNGVLSFEDTLNSGDRFILAGKNKVKTPSNLRIKVFTNLVDANNQADYIAITNRKFSDAVDDYLNFIKNNLGIKPIKVLIGDIYDQFSYGYPYPESIKRFLKAAFEYWRKPEATYLELIGDATYDYKYFIYKTQGVKKSINYVPSYGNPLGDNWFVIWNRDIPIPQMETGRLPIVTSDELYWYLKKRLNYRNAGIKDWRKKYLFFSGGYGNNKAELNFLRESNEKVIEKFIKPRPTAGWVRHFYKTIKPVSNFGPISQADFKKAIDGGAILISYLGHSGTATWDDGINSVEQLQNIAGAYPLITDFGCSTNKFGEPDIISFGEKFLLAPNGQAIDYIGYSSLGFLNLVNIVPTLFIGSILDDSLHEVGLAHIASKIKLFEKGGITGLARIFATSNVLLGDPTVRLQLLNNPELIISKNSLVGKPAFNEESDSAVVKFEIKNIGLAPPLPFSLNISEYFQNERINLQSQNSLLPGFIDTLTYYLNSKGRAGKHLIEISLDPENKIKETDKKNNKARFEINVYSVSLKNLQNYSAANTIGDSLILLNPQNFPQKNFQIILQLSTTAEFKKFRTIKVPSSEFFTAVKLSQLLRGKRYWMRYKIDYPNEELSATKSFTFNREFNFLLNDSVSFTLEKRKNLKYENGLTISNDSVVISVFSAGKYAGSTLVISRNGKNLLTNNFFTGMGLASFNPLTLKTDTAFWKPFFHKPDQIKEMADFIYSLPSGEIVAMGVSDDARNNISSYLIKAIKTLGSSRIDSLEFQGSWALIGAKGLPRGKALEKVSGRYQTAVLIDSIFTVKNNRGEFTTEKIGPAVKWNYAKVNFNKPGNSTISLKILGIENNGRTDTLKNFPVQKEFALNFIPASKYPFIKLIFYLKKGAGGEIPEINKVGIASTSAPELGLNYQSVQVSEDTIVQRQPIELNFSVFNVSRSPADSVRVKTDLILPDGTEKLLYDSTTSFLPFSRKTFSLNYLTNYADGYGNMVFNIKIDPENKIKEFFKYNNSYSIFCFVKKDTSVLFNSAKVKVSFDGKEIFNGDFINNRPEIDFDFHYTFGFNPASPGRFIVYLDEEKVPFKNLEIRKADSSENHIIFRWQPELTTGSHLLEVRGKNILKLPVNSVCWIFTITPILLAKELIFYSDFPEYLGK